MLRHARRSKRLIRIAHGITAVIYKAECALAHDYGAGGVPGWVCAKKVDVDEQNAPHDVEREAALLSAVHHVNVAPLLAAFVETPDSFTNVWYLLEPLYPLSLATAVDWPQWDPVQWLEPPPELDADLLHALRHDSYASCVLALADQLLDALAFLHARGVAHRDVKPGNVLFTRDGNFVLVDFGVAFLDDVPERAAFDPPDALLPPADPLGGPARIAEVGSGAYRAPELLFAPLRGYDPYKADMWSLAATLATVLGPLDRVATASEEDEEAEQPRPYDEALAWERELWPAPEPAPRAPRPPPPPAFHRRTLFDASTGDIGLAGDMFSLLGLPADDAAWPEGRFFQPPLAQFPFVRCAPSSSVLDRLPSLAALQPHGADATLRQFATRWLPRLLQLSASQRPGAEEVLGGLRSMLH